MPQNQCHICGRKPKPKAFFCHFCGTRLKTTPKSPTMGSSESTPKSKSSAPSDKATVSADEEIPAAVEAALILRGKLEQLREQKTAIEEELETIRVKQLVGEFTEAKAKKQVESVEAKLEPLMKEIKNLEEKAGTPLETLQQEQKEQEDRLKRLEELHKSGEVEESVYKRLANEYQSKMDEITQQLGAELDKAHRWLSQLEVHQQQLEFDKETLQVRARIDEISKSDVNKQLKIIEKELAKIKNILDGLRAIIGAPATTIPAPPASEKPKRAKRSKPGKCPFCGNKISSDSKYCIFCGRIVNG
ncbi:MAG: zinc-ribbon domain-containing protein [Promethearchaeota archaeon]